MCGNTHYETHCRWRPGEHFSCMSREGRIHCNCDHDHWFLKSFKISLKVRKRRSWHLNAVWSRQNWGLRWGIDRRVPVAACSLQTWMWSPRCRWSKSWRCRMPLPARSPLFSAVLLQSCINNDREKEKARIRKAKTRCIYFNYVKCLN